MGDSTSWAMFFVGVFLVYAAVVLPIFAVVLRGGVSIANRMLGPQTPVTRPFEERGSGGDYDPDNPFAAPRVQSVAQESPSHQAIPTPKFGWAVLIVFVSFVVYSALRFVGVLLLIRVPPIGSVGVAFGFQALTLALQFVLWSAIRKWMLPTSFGKAALVTVFEFLISLGVLLIIAAFGFVFVTFT